MQMTCKEAITAYSTVARTTFSERKFGWQNGAFKASKLENAIRLAAKEKCKNDPEAVMLDEQDMGKTVVFALSDNNMETPFRLRTYKSDTNCKPYPIWAAARATTCSPSFFRTILVDELSPIGEDFSTATLKCSNPSKDLLEEASQIFGDGRKLGYLVSIGAGNSHNGEELVLGTKNPDRFQKGVPKETLEEIKRANTEAEEMAKELAPIFEKYSKSYIRLTPEFGADGFTLEEWEKLESLTTAVNKYLSEPATAELVNRVVTGLAAKGTDIRLRTMAPSLRTLLAKKEGSQDGSAADSVNEPILMVPSVRNKEFVGREEIMVALEDRLTLGSQGADARVVLVGDEGSGKTEIALEFAYRRNELDSQNVYWVPADSSQVFTTAYYEIAKEMDISVSGLRRQEVLKAVQRSLEDAAEEGDRWLLVVDGADDEDMPELGLLPKTGGHIIYTTSSKEVATKVCEDTDVIYIGGLKEEEAMQMISSLSVGEIARQLVNDLELNPLAISLAVAHLQNTHTSLDQYYRLYQQSIPKLQEMADGAANTPFLPEYMSIPILGTWQITFDYLANEHPESAVMLNYLSQFNHSEIPTNLIIDLTDTPLIPLENPRRLEALTTLQNFALLHASSHPQTYYLHPLLRLLVLNNLHTSGTYQPMIWGLISADSCFPDPRYDNFPLCLSLLPHASASITSFRSAKPHLPLDRFTAKAYYELQLRLARHLFLEGSIAAALEAQDTVLAELASDRTRKADRRISGIEELYLTALTSKALSLFHLARFPEARETLTEAHTLTAARYGEDSDFSLRTLASICRVDSALGSSEEAEMNLREIINRLATLRGVDDSLMAIMNDLARVMLEGYKLDDAVATFKEVHDWYGQQYGEGHPKVVMQALHTVQSLVELSNLEFARVESVEFLMGLEPTLRIALGEGHVVGVWICLIAGVNGVEGEVERVEELVRYCLGVEEEKAEPNGEPSLILLRMWRLLSLILTPTDPEEALSLFAKVRAGWLHKAAGNEGRYRFEITEVTDKSAMLEEALRRHYCDVLEGKGKPRSEVERWGLTELRREALGGKDAAEIEAKFEGLSIATEEEERGRRKGKGRA
ncbi:hypothetical protein BJ508DRAFT_142354 [Ascobolus immersus RN42]|uniref:ORC1/DEAH AAA+ ATPase domain-containing protein n=1 Tax=Ascobolus immersus RN42 TaxID=1160509 RepID=A0A3N4HZR8_ASCIM|nr:hypothetical protein BJ508DRAFT_142354 [Ascobolus immersus RN42]